MEIKQIPILDLIPYQKNARTHSDAQVAQISASITEFGFTNPVLLDGNNGIIAGHGRVLAAQKLGILTVPCIELAHLTPTQKKAYILADNKIALNAGWDDELLRLELGELEELGFEIDLTGFNLFEMALSSPEPEVVNVTHNGKTMAETHDGYDESIIRQIILIYSIAEYDAVIDAMGKYAEQQGLSNNTEVVNHLLETNGYAISQRKTNND